MEQSRNSTADRRAAEKAVAMLCVHHKLKITPQLRKAMEALHLSATRAERRKKNRKTDAERIRDRIAIVALTGRGLASASDIADTTGIPSKTVHAHMAMMKKRVKKARK
ncbi:MAG: hypothetical protein JNM94_08250 [Phycisphaerae bacterium]|nr:hypothetical protein [Phycisphaerae bacterium]